ncbi:hypothetical protein V8J82_15730 [Gymnodinialimonas sp. 2305UL16-5]|uniref:hypothetical protein n=1 Tax=Gymnodinialimonas mytili TaxID=3126503 RepID=UPI0030A13A07
MRVFLPLVVFAYVTPAAAQQATFPVTLDLPAIFSLAEQPYLTEEAFRQALLRALPSFYRDPVEPDLPPTDPLLWSINGDFADPTGPLIGGGILTCARYGVETRDWFASRRATDREVFDLTRHVLPWFDDADIWPDGAIARLACTLVWDDTRSVAIVSQAAAEDVLEQMFEHVAPNTRPDAWATYGDSGYRLDAGGGRADSVVRADSASVILTIGYQELRFRSFLMNGGA